MANPGFIVPLLSDNQYDADVLIIGGGLAGIVTALELLNAGRRVLLLDRDQPDVFGGLARESFGGILVVGSPEQRRSRIPDTPEVALADWLSFGGFGQDDEGEYWPRKWAEAYVHDSLGDVYRWLRGHGIRFLPLPLWVERGQYGGGNSLPRWHVVWGTGQTLATTLINHLQNHPRHHALTLCFGHKVEALEWRGGTLTGCRGINVAGGGSSFTARADCVVVAAGGMNGSLDQVRQHWHRDWGKPPETILNGSHRFADGTLHDAVRQIGGAVDHQDRMWNYASGVHHWRPRKPDHGLSLVPPKSALWLNWRGERIGPEPLVSGFDTRELVTRICQQERQYSWQVLNRTIALKELAISGAEFNVSLRDRNIFGFLRDTLLGNKRLVDEMITHCPDLVIAQTLPELAARMNALQGNNEVQPELMQEAITRYDAEIARGPRLHNDEQLRRIAHLRHWRGDKMRTCHFQPILDNSALPLIAIRQFIISRKSLGGIRTDLESRVLRDDGTPIPGLYAVGEAAGFGGGGMNGLRALEGTFLGGCIYTARRAARAMTS